MPPAMSIGTPPPDDDRSERTRNLSAAVMGAFSVMQAVYQLLCTLPARPESRARSAFTINAQAPCRAVERGPQRATASPWCAPLS
jgi:hypothetical protein